MLGRGMIEGDSAGNDHGGARHQHERTGRFQQGA